MARKFFCLFIGLTLVGCTFIPDFIVKKKVVSQINRYWPLNDQQEEFLENRTEGYLKWLKSDSTKKTLYPILDRGLAISKTKLALEDYLWMEKVKFQLTLEFLEVAKNDLTYIYKTSNPIFLKEKIGDRKTEKSKNKEKSFEERLDRYLEWYEETYGNLTKPQIELLTSHLKSDTKIFSKTPYYSFLKIDSLLEKPFNKATADNFYRNLYKEIKNRAESPNPKSPRKIENLNFKTKFQKTLSTDQLEFRHKTYKKWIDRIKSYLDES